MTALLFQQLKESDFRGECSEDINLLSHAKCCVFYLRFYNECSLQFLNQSCWVHFSRIFYLKRERQFPRLFCRVSPSSFRIVAIILTSSQSLLDDWDVCFVAVPAGPRPQQRFAIEPTDRSAILGDTIVLACRVINKAGTLQWTKDGFGLGIDRDLSGFPRYSMVGSDDEGEPRGAKCARVFVHSYIQAVNCRLQGT